LFRNPLADPYLIGAAPGAGLGAIIVLVTSVPVFYQGVSILPLAAFAGAIGAVSIAYFTARNSDGLPLMTLILAGVAIASLATALSAFILIRSDPDVRPVLSWLMGGFILAQWKHSIMILPYLIPTVIVMLVYGRLLNVMQLGEEHARQLGVSVENLKLLLIISATLSTAAAVAFSGLIGFVGLIVPHSVRLIWGVDYRFILPMSAISGAAFLTLADLVARTIISPIELPVGIITAFCGAPFFIYLLRYRRYVSM
jgi:iron complex transport system permease protein